MNDLLDDTLDPHEVLTRIAESYAHWKRCQAEATEMLNMYQEKVRAAQVKYEAAIADAESMGAGRPKEVTKLLAAQRELDVLERKFKMAASEDKEALTACKVAFKTLIEKSAEDEHQLAKKCLEVTEAWQEVQEQQAYVLANRQERKTSLVLAQKEANTALKSLVQLEMEFEE